MSEERPRRRFAARVAVSALLVGSLVAALATVLGVQACGVSGLGPNVCRGLVRTYAIRIGVFTAVATAVMTLFVVGLGRMSAESDAIRRERRREALGDGG